MRKKISEYRGLEIKIIQSFHSQNMKGRIDLIKNLKSSLGDKKSNGYTAKILGNIQIKKHLKSILFPKELVNLGKFNYYLNESNIDQQLMWISIIINLFSNEINEFIKLSKRYEISLLKGEYNYALNILDEIQEKFGYSLWLIENKISTLELAYGLEKEKEYTNGILSETSNFYFVRYLTSYYSMRSEKNVSYSWYTLTLNEAISSHDENLKGFCLDKLNTHHTSKYDEYYNSININSLFSLIDQYISYIKCMQYSIIVFPDSDIIGLIERICAGLNKHIDDSRIENILNRVSKNGVEYDEDNSLLYILDLYTEGNYASFIIECEKELTVNPLLVDLYEPYLKSINRLSCNLIERETLLSKVLMLLNDILLKSTKVNEAFQELSKIITINSSNRWASQLYNVMCKLYYLNINGSSQNEMISLLNSSNYNPILNNISFSHDRNTEKMNMAQLSTLKLVSSKISKNIEQVSSLSIPEYRKLKYLAIIHELNFEYEQAKEYYTNLVLNATFIVDKYEGLTGLIRCNIALRDFNSCLELIVTNLFENKGLSVIIPFKKLFTALEKYEFCKVPITLPIVYDLYSKFVSTDKDTNRMEAYEDFLFGLDIEKSSELIKYKENFERDKFIWFLREICTIDIMKYSTCFSNYEEVENERLIICQQLIKIDSDNKLNYLNEIKKYTHQKITRTGLKQVEENKIHVDIEGIKRTLDKSLQEGFQRFVSLKNLEAKNPDYIPVLSVNQSQDEETAYVMASNEQHNLLQMMMLELRDTFVSSNEYGLNGYLSIGFRHGTLSGQLRSSLIAEHLVTPKNNKTNVYNLNEHWNKLYSEIPQNKLIKLHELLNKFSRSVDIKINEVISEWIQIKTEKNPEYGMFDFIITIDVMDELYKKILPQHNYLDFFDLAVEILWGMTEESLETIKDRFENELNTSFNNFFDDLVLGIEKLKMGATFVELKNSITRARTALQHDINRVTNWLNRPSQQKIDDYNLQVAVDIALNIMQYTHLDKKLSVNLKSKELKLFKGSTLKGFVDVFHNLFSNAVDNSNLENTEIIVTCEFNESSMLLICKNSLSNVDDYSDAKIKLESIKNDVNQLVSFNRVGDEGGTGLYKIMKLLKVDFELSCEMNYEFTEDNYIVLSIELFNGGKVYAENIGY